MADKWTCDLPEPPPRPALVLSTVGRSKRAAHRDGRKKSSKAWQGGQVRLALVRKGAR